MINLEEVKNCPFTSQEMYDMINSCIDAAEDNGFLNQFVFERALICHEVLHLIEDLDDLDGTLVEENPLHAFAHFIEMGYVDTLINNYSATINYVGEVAAQYFTAYEKYLLSFGGVINKSAILSSDMLEKMAGQVSALANNDEIKRTLEIAQE